jgi:hypothetical protein
MIRKIHFPILFVIELVAIYFLSGPLIEKPDHSLNVMGSRMQLVCFILIVTVLNFVSEKYRKPTTIGLMFLYIVFLIVARRLNVL